MFTGIITDIGTLKSRKGNQFEIACNYDASTIDIGASIACDGVCLTVTARQQSSPASASFLVDVSKETLDLTTISDWREGHKINLERALKMGDEFGGHIVTGHIDGVAEIKRIEKGEAVHSVQLAVPEKLKIYIAKKGSVTLNGVSLTVNDVDDCQFEVNIIPHTHDVTTWRECEEGTLMNIEVDILARYALRASECRSELK